MRILLLGATGYLGSNIAYELYNAGHEVLCIVREASNRNRLDGMNIQLISNKLEDIEVVFKTSRIDWIINSICVYKENDSLYEDMIVANMMFPLSILNLAIKYGVKNYITCGTSLPEEFNLYSFSKSQFSKFGKYLSYKDEFNFAELQLEMFYGGKNEPQDRFLNSCKCRMQKGEILQLTEGYQKRDIVRVEDVVAIIKNLIETNYIKGYIKLPIGSGENHPIREIILYMKRQLNSRAILEFGAIPTRVNEPDTLANIEWYKDVGYNLKFSYFEGLEDICCR